MKKRHLYKDEIRKSLIIYTISFMVIGIVLIYAFLSVYTLSTIRKRNNDFNDTVNRFLSQEIEKYVDEIYDMEEGPALREYFTGKDNESEIYEQLYAFNNESNIKSIFYIVDTQGKTVLTNNYVESPYDSYTLFLSGLFKQLKENPEEIVYINNKIQIDLTKRTIYSIGKTIRVDGEIKGYLIFDLLESDLKKLAYSSDVDIFIITDKYSNEIVTTNGLVLDNIGKFTLAKRADNPLEFMGKKYYFCKSELLDGQMYIYTLSELDLIGNLFNISIIFLVIMIPVISIIIYRVADRVSTTKTRSIEQLIDSISQVEKGNLEAYVSIKSNDEFEKIGDQFNRMLLELNRLIERNNELIDRNRISQIKQLESQFNPHFIFNTLQTLKYMIHLERDKASDFIVNFSNILRYSIDYEKKTVTLEQDLDYLRSYLMIQKYRFNKRLTYEFDIDENAKQCIVPKLILQPIIENCINHGYKDKESLHIRLEILKAGNELEMIIRDNGDGIPEFKLTEIREGLDDDSNNIGLSNVHRRLKLSFGERYGLNIDSKKGEGTIVTIKMPCQKW